MDNNVSSKSCQTFPVKGQSILTVQVVTYALIYDFLSRRSHTKAAEAVKKAAGGSVDASEVSGANLKLEDIVKGWKGTQPQSVAVQ